MRTLKYLVLIILTISFNSCRKEIYEASFENLEKNSIYDYLIENKENFSDFISILEKGDMDKTLSAYNPNGTGYTLFAPDNSAIAQFINETQQFSSLNDILSDKEYATAFSKYHVLNMKAHTNEFPFGSFIQPALSGDFLTVSFVVGGDTSYYNINNQAAVIKANIEVSNGYVHHIKTALRPVTYTAFQWLKQNSGFEIFKGAVDLTGLQAAIDINMKESERTEPITVILEHDSIYNKSGINSLADLAAIISPESDDYTNPSNPLYNFVAYHFLSGRFFIDNFVDVATNYQTFSEVPLNINGLGLDIVINKGKEVFDTIVNQLDTTIIDYIRFLYDESNVITQSGPIHFVDQVMKQQIPSRAIRIFEFNEEPLFSKYRQHGAGTFKIDDDDEDKELLKYIEWSGSDLFFIDLGEQSSSSRGSDYLMIDGDFSISYNIPKIVQGRYKIFLGADQFSKDNALVEVSIDGKKVGGLVDLTSGGSFTTPFRKIELGTVDFTKYSEHIIEINTIIPGRLLWDYIRFEPY